MSSYEMIDGRMVPTDDTCSHVGPLWLPQDYPDADKLRAEVNRSSRLNGPTGHVLYFDDPYTSIYKLFWTCPTCKGIRCIWVAALFRGPPDPPGPHPCARCDHWTTRDGVSLAWHEIGDRHLVYIARHLERRLERWRVVYGHPPDDVLVTASREALGFALTEASYRGLLPTPEEIHVAWDLACSKGQEIVQPAEIYEPRPLTLIELWVEFIPRLRGSHAPPWTRLTHRKVA